MSIRLCSFIFVIFFYCSIPQAHAFIFISEILADPAAGPAGDANSDGVASSSDDEFVELFNDANEAVDLSGWSLSDALRTRHVFPSGSVLPKQQFLVIFGSNASTGTLSLNNTGDTVTLYDSAQLLIDQVTFGPEAGQDKSIVRLSNGAWQQSSQFSPGYSLDGVQEQSVTVPELPSVLYLVVGMIILFNTLRFRFVIKTY